jgi:hypothetical protein
MIERKQAERLARSLNTAWALAYGTVPGPADEARSFLTWLDRFRLDPELPLCRELTAAASSEETPIALSECNEHAAIRWFKRREYLFGCSAEGAVYVIPACDVTNIPELAPQTDGGTPPAAPPYEKLL